jgi:hypothetical protein
VTEETCDPDHFVRWTYARALAHRQPRYAAMARWGVTVTAEEVGAVATRRTSTRSWPAPSTAPDPPRPCNPCDNPLALCPPKAPRILTMPITLPETLPAFDVLRSEGVMVMSPDRAAHQDIRPLRIGLLNLMPKKIQTENQFARLIGATPLQIDLHLIRMSEHTTKNTAAEHMATFYRPFQEVKGREVRRVDHHRRPHRTSRLRGGHLLG